MFETKFKAKNGKVYKIKINDFGEEITVYLGDDKQGSISLTSIEMPNSTNELFRITNLSLEKCKRHGVGTSCLKFHKKSFNSTLTAGSSDGQKCNDGSHLTADGVPFIERMRELGIVEPEYDDY